MSQLYKNAIFWVEVDKIKPNQYQPRKEFNEDSLMELADSVRQYGILQPLVVTRREQARPEGGIEVSYELIAGERRLRASKIASLRQVPVIIREGDDEKVRFELAIIENLQREDLNPVDRAVAFQRLVDEFSMSHVQVAKKIGKSREYVTNTLRLLGLPQYILDAITDRRITEGHARSLMMLSDRPEEQETLFKDILFTKMSVRETERIARSIAKDRAKKQSDINKDPELRNYEERFARRLGTRVRIDKNKGNGGKLVIDFFKKEDLGAILDAFIAREQTINLRPSDEEMEQLTKATPLQKPKEEKTPPKLVEPIPLTPAPVSKEKPEREPVAVEPAPAQPADVAPAVASTPAKQDTPLPSEEIVLSKSVSQPIQWQASAPVAEAKAPVAKQEAPAPKIEVAEPKAPAPEKQEAPLPVQKKSVADLISLETKPNIPASTPPVAEAPTTSQSSTNMHPFTYDVAPQKPAEEPVPAPITPKQDPGAQVLYKPDDADALYMQKAQAPAPPKATPTDEELFAFQKPIDTSMAPDTLPKQPAPLPAPMPAQEAPKEPKKQEPAPTTPPQTHTATGLRHNYNPDNVAHNVLASAPPTEEQKELTGYVKQEDRDGRRFTIKHYGMSEDDE